MKNSILCLIVLAAPVLAGELISSQIPSSTEWMPQDVIKKDHMRAECHGIGGGKILSKPQALEIPSTPAAMKRAVLQILAELFLPERGVPVFPKSTARL